MKIVATQSSTVEQLISEKMKGISKSKIKQWIKFKQLSLNDELVTRLDEAIEPQDILFLSFDKPLTLNKVFKPRFEVVFEDKNLIVCLKPAGILTAAEGGDENSSFYKQVQQYVKENSKGRERLYVVHRLDREVAGLILFAKTEFVQKTLKDHWQDNTKRYFALVEGSVSKDDGKIESYLYDDPKTLLVRSVEKNENAKLAITHFKVLERFKDKTLLEVELETGRKNQIRVHLSEMGHPIIGDRRYGANDKFERQIRLFSFFLRFKHPVTQEWIELKKELPSFFLHLPAKNENYK